MELTFYDIWRTIRHPIEVLKEELITRKMAEIRIRSVDMTLFYHVIKCLITTDIGLFNHWSSEIKGYFQDMEFRLKPSGKRVKANNFFNWLFLEPLTGVDGKLIQSMVFARIDRMKEDGNVLSQQTDFNQLFAAIFEFYTIFCMELSKNERNVSFIVPLLTKLRMQVVGEPLK